MDSRTELTKELLNCIAKHLSSRRECQGVTYRVALGMKDESSEYLKLKDESEHIIDFNHYISFFPRIDVYRDRYHRKSCDKSSVEEHVILYHFSDSLYCGRQTSGHININKDLIVPGVYEYQPSIDKKRRRWVRIK